VPITINPEELLIKSPNETKLIKIFTDLEFKSVLQRIIRNEGYDNFMKNPVQGSLI
jgi:hypothetical protein